MATIKTENTLKIYCAFVDGDTRTITLKNPRSDLANEDFQTLNSYIVTNNLLIGDKTGAIFASIQKAVKGTTTTRTIDF